MHETCPRNADTCRRRAEKGEKQPYEIGHGNIYLGQPVTLFLLTRSSLVHALVAPRRPRVQSTRPRPTGHFVVGIPGRHAPQPTSPRGRLAFYFWIRNPAMLPGGHFAQTQHALLGLPDGLLSSIRLAFCRLQASQTRLEAVD